MPLNVYIENLNQSGKNLAKFRTFYLFYGLEFEREDLIPLTL